MKLEELNEKIDQLDSYTIEKRNLEEYLEDFMSETNMTEELTYLPVGRGGCYISTKALIELLKNEIKQRKSKISKIKKEIGVDE